MGKFSLLFTIHNIKYNYSFISKIEKRRNLNCLKKSLWKEALLLCQIMEGIFALESFAIKHNLNQNKRKKLNTITVAIKVSVEKLQVKYESVVLRAPNQHIRFNILFHDFFLLSPRLITGIALYYTMFVELLDTCIFLFHFNYRELKAFFLCNYFVIKQNVIYVV